MKKQKIIFESEPTPIANSSRSQIVDTVAVAGAENSEPIADKNTKVPSSEWDADKTEVLISTDNSESNLPSLITEDGAVYLLEHFPYSIGRDKTCDLHPEGKGISRKHAEIHSQYSRFLLKDLESANGVKVNGHSVSQAILENNDSITIGNINFTFKQTTEKALNSDTNLEIDIPSLQALREGHSASSKKPYFKVLGLLTIIVAMGYFGFSFYKTQTQSFTIPKTSASSKDEIVVPGKPLATTGVKTSAPTPTTDKVKENKASKTKKENSITKATTKKSFTNPKKSKNYSAAPLKPISKAPAQSTPTIKPNIASKEEIKKITSNAISTYIKGDATKALNNLKNTDLSGNEISILYFNFNTMHTFYELGNQALKDGHKDKTMSLWTEYLADAKKMVPDQSSPYQKEAINFLAIEYKRLAQQAEQNKHFPKAYIYWDTLYDLTVDSDAKAALIELDEQAQDMYRNGLRQEYINIERALQNWEQVLVIVPPGNKYHNKASEKIKMYNQIK